jgi:hypothetical protein
MRGQVSTDLPLTIVVCIRMNKVLLLSGTCGSGKTTISKLIAKRWNWERICEDDIWPELFGKDRGDPRLPEGKRKRAQVHEIVFDKILEYRRHKKNIVIDLTVHEAPPDAFFEYKEFFEANGIPFEIRILHLTIMPYFVMNLVYNTLGVGQRGILAIHPTTAPYRLSSYPKTQQRRLPRRRIAGRGSPAG